MKRDLQKFRRAHESDKFSSFLDLTEHLTQFNRQIEQLFLNRKVPEAAFRELADEMKSVHATIKQMAEECPMLYDTDRSMGELAINSSDLGLEEE